LAKQKKLEGYKKAMALIFSLRNKVVGTDEERNEKDFQILKMSENILLSNSSISTLWNIRRQIILSRIDNSESDDTGISQEEKEVLLEKERDLTQHCLMSDPKSYGAWHHRGWAMQQMKDAADWQREVDLTTRFLQMDERNFHCWDYRRFVLTKLSDSQTSSVKELQFSTDAIHTNFSNYSAWHYRSKLLPLVHPNEKSLIGISEQVRRDELDLVQNAAFTDPEDSSAWFYHRWLLASGDTHDAPPKIQLVKKIPGTGKILVATSKDIKGGSCLSCLQDDALQFASPLADRPSDSLWLAECSDLSRNLTIVLTVDGREVDRVEISSSVYVSPELLSFRTSKNDDVTDQLLVDEMDNCRQLLELEPDSKWTMLTLALIAQSVDPHKHYEEIVAIYDNLTKIDAKRKNYYKDQKSKFVTRHQLTKFFQCMLQDEKEGGEGTIGDSARSVMKLDLSKKGLTVVYFKHLLSVAKEIDLSYNDLKSVEGILPYLIECEKLNLEGYEGSKFCSLPEKFKDVL